MIATLISFYRCFFYFLNGGLYKSCPYFTDLTRAKVHVHSLALIFIMWSKDHYRNDSFHIDMRKNLRNVAVPGTGIPLSVFCYTKFTAYLFILFIYPILCLLAAHHYQRTDNIPIQEGFKEHLLTPQDWFSYWRLNCCLASLHALKTKADGYRKEDKWTFLKEGNEAGIPVSPFLDVYEVVVKDRNEEGGMGLFFYKNAVHGGDWIIQERLYNCDFIANLLPISAPLSTVRVITCSTAWLNEENGKKATIEDIHVLSTVFRAGRNGSETDHSSILFDVDQYSGKILRGTTNDHWYKLGLNYFLRSHLLSVNDVTHHPDNNKQITGNVIPNFIQTLKMVQRSHLEILPDISMVGWDVAFCSTGNFILEVNLSCNFFRGTFDLAKYVSIVDRYFSRLGEIPFEETKKEQSKSCSVSGHCQAFTNTSEILTTEQRALIGRSAQLTSNQKSIFAPLHRVLIRILLQGACLPI